MVDVIERSHYFIFAQVKLAAHEDPWILGAIYGDPHDFVTEYIWDRLVHYSTRDQRPLCVIGDFNSIYSPFEKFGGSSKVKRKHRLFQSMVAASGLVDLGYHGPAYTWTNNRHVNNLILQRLDRSLATVPWCVMYPNAKLFHLPRANSDHSPILLKLRTDVKKTQRKFKFENWWLLRDEFKEVCESAVKNADGSWRDATIRLKQNISKWARKKRGPSAALAEIEQKILYVQSTSPSPETIEADRALQAQYNLHLLEVESYWAQRATIRWATLGDSNTQFFHQAVAQRRRCNRIASLTLQNGDLISDERQVRRAFIDHFKGIYREASEGPGVSFEPQFCQTLPKVPSAEAECMIVPPTVQEIIEAAFSIHPDRASGPDGINGRVVQTFWPIFAPTVINEVLTFFNTAQFSPGIADSNMILVPKIHTPTEVSHYRPISVCNFMYKVVSKILCLRMKRVIAMLVLPNQTAFTPGREISENIIVLREIMHSFGTARFQQPAFCYKCDLSKAFDRMRWDFVFHVLACYGFPGQFVEWIRACVTSAKFSIMFNGHADGFISPKRGLRQGCALSPYLFILCMDVLSRQLEFQSFQGYISGIRLTRGAPRLTSIMFADDLIILGEASEIQAVRTQLVLQQFCRMSGQRVGDDKSCLWFSRATDLQMQQCVMSIFNASLGDNSHVYLGVPVQASRPTHFGLLVT
ncbi:hypothetical protein LUZ62_055948 [Rhynchospora pubera]|uniref:Reverse transcriptase domain-containing protein n=1 Tax=Rhynchospora pubera TaxID=906938 RepID=A0AAV8DXQ6_9POAL|nr:hypothetical protein LUZ62_055948 [Rhynchospora pubera]